MTTITAPTEPCSEALYCMVYLSKITASGLLGPSTINDISKTAVRNNCCYGLTGLLCYGNGYFFQYVEGSEHALTHLKNSLLMDDRHQDMTLLKFACIDKRVFGHWVLQTLILEPDRVDHPATQALLPFRPAQWQDGDWVLFLEQLKEYYEGQDYIQDQPLQYSTLGVSLVRLFSDHQAFFLIQAILAVLIVLTLMLLAISGTMTS